MSKNRKNKEIEGKEKHREQGRMKFELFTEKRRAEREERRKESRPNLAQFSVTTHFIV